MIITIIEPKVTHCILYHFPSEREEILTWEELISYAKKSLPELSDSIVFQVKDKQNYLQIDWEEKNIQILQRETKLEPTNKKSITEGVKIEKNYEENKPKIFLNIKENHKKIVDKYFNFWKNLIQGHGKQK